MNDEMEHSHAALEEELETGFARMFLREERGQAQAWVNWLDEVRMQLARTISRLWLSSHHMQTIELLPTHSDLYKRSVHKLRDLCGQTGSLPEGYTLTDAIALNDPDPISHGGFSDVYRAMCSGRPVALKVLRVSVDDRANVRKVTKH
jgi:predicted unusual protein kinase regulating ubiquinone biosynthesis (AarF/ABC1/UbiB family)